jgi:hypothetical protein
MGLREASLKEHPQGYYAPDDKKRQGKNPVVQQFDGITRIL